MQLEGVACLLTGATGGIGSSLAKALADAGARLVLSARDSARLDRLAADLPRDAVVATFAGDLTESNVRPALRAIAECHSVALLINLAGENRFGLFEHQRSTDVDELLRTNLIAPIELTQLLLPHLRTRPAAMIVNVGSAFGAIGYPGYALYCASKFGLRGFSEALARELSDGTVRVVYVAPRATRTGMNSAAASALNAALGNAEDVPDVVAHRILEAIRSERRHVAIGLTERCIAGLNQLAPAIVDGAISKQLATIKSFAIRPSEEGQHR